MAEVHSDYDGIPDHIEKRLNLDHTSFDSDLDGQSDYYELVIEPQLNKTESSSSPTDGRPRSMFVGTAYAQDSGVTTRTTPVSVQSLLDNKAGVDWSEIVKNPPDSDGDGKNDALDPLNGAEYEGNQDQDLDRIPDVYEAYGYSWDYTKNVPVPWGFRFTSDTSIALVAPDELDYSIRYFKTNIHNAFSDWDAYDDYRESSLDNMEATVLPPTNHPGVASLPNFNIVVDSVTLTITANQITFPAHSVLRGYKQKTILTHVEDKPVAKYLINLGAGSISKSAKAYSEGLINVDSKTVGSVIAEGIDLAIGPTYKTVADYEEVVDVTDWLNATVDSAHKGNAAAATVKWRLLNNGNDAAYDIKPTFNVMLGSDLIHTYTSQEIASIRPRSSSNQFVTTDINLSFDQLKAYMTGSPLNTRVNQVSADVMTRHKIDESPSKEDWDYFVDNMRANCATVTVDLGDGKVGTFKTLAVHPLGPAITLRDTLTWAIGRYDDNGKNTSTAVRDYFGNASSDVPDFNDWVFYFSGGVDPNNPDTAKDITPDADNILDTVILPSSTIYAKAPSAESPVISWAKMSPVYNAASEACELTNMHEKRVDALVHDYFGVRKVSFEATPGAIPQEMTDEEGDGIYSLVLPRGYEPTYQETILALREQLLTSDPEGKSVVSTATVGYTAPVGKVYSGVKNTLTVPKSNSDYGDLAFFDLEGEKHSHKRGKLSDSAAIDQAVATASDISIDMNFYRVNEDSTRYNDYTAPHEYPVIGWYLASGQAPNANISFWPDDSISYAKLSFSQVSTSTGTRKLSPSKSSSKGMVRYGYTQGKYPNGTFSFRTSGGRWVKLQIEHPYDLQSHKWRVWQRALPDPTGSSPTDVYNYYWRYQPKSVTINYTIYDKQP